MLPLLLLCQCCGRDLHLATHATLLWCCPRMYWHEIKNKNLLVIFHTYSLREWSSTLPQCVLRRIFPRGDAPAAIKLLQMGMALTAQASQNALHLCRLSHVEVFFFLLEQSHISSLTVVVKGNLHLSTFTLISIWTVVHQAHLANANAIC